VENLKKIILLLTGLVLMALLIESAIAQEAAPNFTLTDIDGANFSLSDQKGKVVLLDFFAIMCASCITEMQSLNVIHQEFGENVTIVSITENPDIDTVAKLQQFRQDNNMTWIVARDTEGLGDTYNVQVLPTLVIIDKEGYIQYRHTDIANASVLEQEISPIIPEFGTSTPAILVFLTIPIAVAIVYRRRLNGGRLTAKRQTNIRRTLST